MSSEICNCIEHYNDYQHATVMVSEMRTRGPVMMQLYNSLSPSDRIQAVVDYCTTLLTTTLMGGTTNIMEKL